MIIELKSQVSDNWFYLVVDGGECFLVDPVDSAVAIHAVRHRGLKLLAVVNTHWHPDHISGDDQVCDEFPDAALLVPAFEREKIASMISTPITGGLAHGDIVEVGGAVWTVISTPGHTHGHISIHRDDEVLSGDLMFAAGAGHCRSGDPTILFRTYETVIQGLPTTTKLYPGHDYAIRNLEFALSIDDSQEARSALAAARDGSGFRPLFLAEQRVVNPFLRVWEQRYQDIVRAHAPEVWMAWSQRTASPAETAFCVLRELRNSW